SSVCLSAKTLRSRRADEELARSLAGRLHTDPLLALHPPAAEIVELDDVAGVRPVDELHLPDRQASVRKDELEAVADGLAEHVLSSRLPEERHVSLDVRE